MFKKGIHQKRCRKHTKITLKVGKNAQLWEKCAINATQWARFASFTAHGQSIRRLGQTNCGVTETFDLQLIKSCKQGNRASQKILYDRLAPRMFPVCLRYVSDRSLAEDILQDGFITLFTKLNTYKGDGSFEGWARRIFVTTALMALRKKDALKMSDELEAVRGMKADTSTQIQNLGYKELLALIMSLPTGFRTVFNLYAIEGYSHKEIAEMLGITETTSRTQLSRARIWLQKKLSELENA